jgi:protein TonB
VRRTFGGAFGVSAVTHAAIFLLILFVMGRMPDPASSRRPSYAPYAPDSIVWISGPGAGGGDGGGNRTTQPPRRAEAPGHDRVTVPARPPAALGTPAVMPPAEPRIDIPAHPTAAGLTELPGVIAPTAASTLSLGAGSGASAGDGRRRGLGDGAGDGLGEGRDKGAGGGFPQPGTNGISQPRLIREVKPLYSNGALQARIQGTVLMQAVVLGNGSVGDVWITRSLDRAFGIDQEAVRTVKQWRFTPALQSGRPVAVVVPIEMQFTIR